MKLLALLLLSGCTYHLHVDPIPVVLSWGGSTPDAPLVLRMGQQIDAGIYRLEKP